MTRQRIWQLEMQAAGKCIICAQPRTEESKYFCAGHLDVVRIKNRNKYRLKKGINLTAPLQKTGRPKGSKKVDNDTISKTN
jgi:hypothetical protein